MSPTPPNDDSLPSTPDPNNIGLNLDSLNSRLLDPNNATGSGSGSGSGSAESGSTTISRAQSIMNLTSSTLFGIYSMSSQFEQQERENTFYGMDHDYDESLTPWGTGTTKLDEDDLYYELQRVRSQSFSRRISLHPPPKPPPLTRSEVVVYLGLRAAVLFGLGVMYGALVARVQDRHQKLANSLQMEHMVQPTVQEQDWRYLIFWGVSGVLLGGLLPWFDGVWEGTFGKEERAAEAAAIATHLHHNTVGVGAVDEKAADWALVVRGIGCFAGIVYAMRKLPWASTLQVSLTLALVNPFLWYLIDRSKPGFLLSAAVGVTGSAILMGLKPDIVPTPISPSFGSGASSSYITGNSNSNNGSHIDSSPMVLGGLASQETLETGIWVLSVLFCCCVCFGNIGRRMALNRSSSGKGRWAQR